MPVRRLCWIGLVAALAAASGVHGQVRAIGSWWDRTAVLPGHQHPTSRHYELRSDLPRSDTRAIARYLDFLHDEFERGVALPPVSSARPLRVMLFSAADEMAATLRTRFGVEAEGRAGFFFDTPQGAAVAVAIGDRSPREIRRTIRRAAFLQLASARFGGNLPPWVAEGLAAVFGTAEIIGDRMILPGAPPTALERVQQLIETGQTVPWVDMLTMDRARWELNLLGGRGDRQRLQAWSMVQFLMTAEQGRYAPALDRFLRLAGSGMQPVAAFAQAFETNDVAWLDRRWQETTSREQVGQVAAAFERLDFLSEGLAAVHDRGVDVGTLEELRSELRRLGFVRRHGELGFVLELRASDDRVFELPRLAVGERPSLVVEPIRTGPRDAPSPVPVTLVTRDLAPFDLQVRWTDAGGERTHFEIDQRPRTGRARTRTARPDESGRAE